MKRILIVFTTGFVPYGGLTSVMMNYYRAIDKKCLHFDFACTNTPPQSLLDEISLYGSTYKKLPPRKNIFKYFFCLKKLCKNYDIIHVHGNSSTSVLELQAAKLAGVKKRIVHNHNSVTEHGIINKLLHPFFVKSYTTAVACSKIAGDWLFGENQFLVLRNAIDIDKYIPKLEYRTLYRSQLGITEDEIVIGHVGKMVVQKNHKFILSVFSEYHKKNRNSKLLLVGGGIEEEKIKKSVKLLNLQDCVVFAGLRTDIPELLSTMDIFLFPSLWEGLPLAAIEAQSSGLPVLLSDVISKEVLISENCFSLSLSKDAANWAKFIYECVDITQRDKFVNFNKHSLTEAGYNIKVASKSLLKLYMK